jgi:ABC-type antimicrobial peptide transport system permease subunit
MGWCSSCGLNMRPNGATERGAAKPLALGLAIGLPIAWGLGRLLSSLTEHIRGFSLDAFVLNPLLLVAVALLAVWLPARRATRIAPSECLRADR